MIKYIQIKRSIKYICILYMYIRLVTMLSMRQPCELWSIATQVNYIAGKKMLGIKIYILYGIISINSIVNNAALVLSWRCALLTRDVSVKRVLIPIVGFSFGCCLNFWWNNNIDTMDYIDWEYTKWIITDIYGHKIFVFTLLIELLDYVLYFERCCTWK